MNDSHLGINVSKLKLDVALLTEQGLHSSSFSNDLKGFRALERWLQRFPGSMRVCLEATGVYGQGVACFLHERQKKVSIVNPLMVHHFAKSRLNRNKTDTHDAELIARFSQQNNPRLWQPPTPEQEIFRHLVRVREQLVQSCATAQHHLESAPAVAARFFKAQIRLLQKQIANVEEQIQKICKANAEMSQAVGWLTSIPGVGQTTAVSVLAIMPAMDQIDNARQLAAFAGVTPAQKQSGKNPGKTRMSKLGHSRLRKALYLPALSALRHNPRAKELAQRLKAKGKRPMVIVGAVMRLLLHLMYGVLKNRAAFDPNHLKARPIQLTQAAGRL